MIIPFVMPLAALPLWERGLFCRLDLKSQPGPGQKGASQMYIFTAAPRICILNIIYLVANLPQLDLSQGWVRAAMGKTAR
jgi:hypothetical protein